MDHSAAFSTFGAYGLGILACLTPCVYPLIPVTLSVLGTRDHTNKTVAFLLSLSYVIGLSLTYTLLGVLTAKLGLVFGSLLGNPWIVIPMAGLFILLALHTLSVISLPLGGLQSRANAIGGTGYLGAFCMGTVSGAVAAPCVGPVLSLLLVEVAKSPDVGRAIILLLSYSLGLGTPFLILGTCSSLLTKIPRSGHWLQNVKLLVAALLFSEVFIMVGTVGLPIIPKASLTFWLIAFCVALGVGIKTVRFNHRGTHVFGCTIIALTLTGVLSPHVVTDKKGMQWNTEFESSLDQGKALHRPIMIDLSAKWCAACKELEHTFSRESVSKLISDKIIPVQIDFTTENDLTRKLSSQFQVVGLPCVLFLDSSGAEIKDSRIVGALSENELAKHIEKIVRGLS